MKKGREREKRLSVIKSVKERIPNLPKSSVNPVSPRSLILSVFDARSTRRMNIFGEALGEREEMLFWTKILFWVKSSDEGQQLNDGHYYRKEPLALLEHYLRPLMAAKWQGQAAHFCN